MEYIISPSLLAADFLNLESQITQVAEATNYLHLDMMDHHFVPNLAIGIPMVRQIRKKFPDLFLDCHIMVENPQAVAPKLIDAHVNNITFHAESIPHYQALKLLFNIKSHGIQASVAISPGTDPKILKSMVPTMDQVLVMTVNPGFGGQKFIPSQLEVIGKIHKTYPDLPIQVDGGISENSLKDVIEAGATNFVMGSSVFRSSKTIAERITFLHLAAESYRPPEPEPEPESDQDLQEQLQQMIEETQEEMEEDI